MSSSNEIYIFVYIILSQSTIIYVAKKYILFNIFGLKDVEKDLKSKCLTWKRQTAWTYSRSFKGMQLVFLS